jgi:signal transduction histidine kinase/ActR/RegA family two-component response regulator
MFGVQDPSVLIGRGFDLVAESTRPALEERLRDRLKGDVTPYEQTIVRSDGTSLDLWIAGMPTVFEGEPATIVFVVDRTEQRRLESQLVATERLASLGRLAASVGHEINNPLTYVIGNLEIAARAMRSGRPPDDLAAMLDAALGGAEQVRRIVEDLRLFTQHKSEALRPVDLKAVVESCVRMSAGELRHRAKIIQSIAEGTTVLASEPRLAQVLTNLLLNAAQALPRGASETNTVTVAARTIGGRVELVIEDTGEGVAPEHLPHVFEPFFTTKTERGGSGLGLAICRTLVAAQNGEIAFDSEPGKGTRVTVRLQAADHAEAGNGAEVHQRAAPSRRVLLVDDDAQILAVLSRSLAPHEVTTAINGHDALHHLEQGGPFDVIVCDLMMPDVSGVDIYERVRARYPGIEERIVFMTGGITTPTAPDVVASLPNACLHKPFSIATLLDAIERVAAS